MAEQGRSARPLRNHRPMSISLAKAQAAIDVDIRASDE